MCVAGGGMGNMSLDRMGSSFDRMGMSGMDMNRSFSGYGHMGGSMSDRVSGSKAGCQIFVRNVSLSRIKAFVPYFHWYISLGGTIKYQMYVSCCSFPTTSRGRS